MSKKSNKRVGPMGIIAGLMAKTGKAQRSTLLEMFKMAGKLKGKKSATLTTGTGQYWTPNPHHWFQGSKYTEKMKAKWDEEHAS